MVGLPPPAPWHLFLIHKPCFGTILEPFFPSFVVRAVTSDEKVCADLCQG